MNTPNYNHQYYMKHKERCNSKNRQWYANNRAKMAEWQKEYRKENKEYLAHMKIMRKIKTQPLTAKAVKLAIITLQKVLYTIEN